MKIAAVLGLLAACFAPQQPASMDAAPRNIATAERVEGLTEAARIVLATDYVLSLEPGVRASKQNDAYSISTYDGKKVRFQSESEIFSLHSPVMARLTPAGWDLGTGKTYAASSLTVMRDEQDDTDSNLKSMQENARKLKNKPNGNNQQANNTGKRKGSWRFLFGSSNPFGTSEAFNQAAIQQSTHISAIGF